MMPMITSTTVNSMSEKPRPGARWSWWTRMGASGLMRPEHGPAEAPDRQQHAERQDQHEDREEHDHDRLDLRAERLQLVLDLALVHLGDLLHEVVELARLVAHRDHLQHHRREDARGHRRAQDAFASLDAVAHLLDALRDVVVVHDLADHAEALHHGDAAADREREAPGEARERRLEHDLAGDGNAQLELV